MIWQKGVSLLFQRNASKIPIQLKDFVLITAKLGLTDLDQWNLSNTRWRTLHCSKLHDFRFHKTYPALKITNAAAEGSGQKTQQSPYPKGTPKGWINAMAQKEENFTPSVPALATIQPSQVKVGMATSTTNYSYIYILCKNLILENPNHQHPEALTFFSQAHTVRLICAIVIYSLAWPSEIQCSPGQYLLMPWSPNGLKPFRVYAHKRQGWWKLFHLWCTEVEDTLFIPHRKPMARMGIEYRSSKLQSGTLNSSYFLPEYSLCVCALEMPFLKSRQSNLFMGCWCLKPQTFLSDSVVSIFIKMQTSEEKDIVNGATNIFSLKFRAFMLHESVMYFSKIRKFRNIWAYWLRSYTAEYVEKIHL